MSSCITVNNQNLISHLTSLGYPIGNTMHVTTLYNNNKAFINWCHNMTTKGYCHIKNLKNLTPEWVANGIIAINHVARKCNIANIFTNELQDSANFCRLCDSLMCRLGKYLRSIHNISHSKPSPPNPVSLYTKSMVLAKPAHYFCPSQLGILDVLISYPYLNIPSALLCISSTGHHLLSHLAPSSYHQALVSDPIGGVSK
jgi:hypothetical protein